MIDQKQSNTLKTKGISPYKEAPKQFLNPTPTPKVAHWGPKNLKMTPKLSQTKLEETKKIKSKSNVRIKANIENESYSTT